ncbi:LysE family translocator [Calidifontibacter sp. DB0510]|uniref:LysE family translocator n=1 Tax=Metallococcus carri TaxID=1656884 RepID=A0A967AZD7_9MICO|nr:LysE family translocator [Metallococcus carri]NHN54620.1 LysE family translocator [Metallococcus carri]NOP36541.1 LysE family translocator [Calidifontibacter sp. DB2511S]
MGIDWPLYLGVVLLAYLIPGPDFLLVMRWSVRRRRLGMAAAAGAMTGLTCHMLLATAGLSLLLARYTAALTAIRIVGGLYLVVLGCRIVAGTLHRKTPTSKQAHPDAADDGDDVGLRRAFLQGWLSNMTNPKAILFFAAVLPQFVNPAAATPSWLQISALGFADVVTGVLPWTVVILVGGALSGALSRPRVQNWWDRCTGTVLGVFGIGVVARG